MIGTFEFSRRFFNPDWVTDLVGDLGLGVVGCEPEHLLEVAEGLVDVVLVVEAEAADVHGVGVHAVGAEEVVGHLLGLGVAAEEGQALGAHGLERAAGSGQAQGAVEVV